jgi:hypothetical protein
LGCFSSELASEMLNRVGNWQKSLGGGGTGSQQGPVPAQDRTEAERTRTHIHASSGIRTHEPIVRVNVRRLYCHCHWL